jgi:riboflavin biosynthesis pyrimidine reductase
MPGRSEGLPIEPIWHVAETVTAGTAARGGPLPPELAARFPGELSVALRADRPTVVANFVSSLDGAVALGPDAPNSGGGEISGFSEADRYMMALLRGLADVVVVGAGTARVGRRHEWTPRRLQPALAEAFAAWRAEMGLAPQPTTIVVTASGSLDPGHAGLNAPDVPVIVATTAAGATRLAALSLPENVTVAVGGNGDRVQPDGLLEIVRGTGARLALCEGGPHLFGQLLGAGLIDELFLTLAPHLVGRDETVRRLSLVEEALGEGRWASLASVRRAGDDLFLRYRFEP